MVVEKSYAPELQNGTSFYKEIPTDSSIDLDGLDTISEISTPKLTDVTDW